MQKTSTHITTLSSAIILAFSCQPASAQGLGISLIEQNLTSVSFMQPSRTGHLGDMRLEGASPKARLRSLIALAEAGPKGYDAVQYSAHIKPSKRPTDMTVAEIFKWIETTPNQNHAIGRYQFIPSTLRSLIKRTGTDETSRFSPALQDRLADLLLADAGYKEFSCGRVTQYDFMHRLTRIWAGLPTSSGQSAYAGHAGNAATLTWAKYTSAMGQAFPVDVIKANAQNANCS